MRDDKPSPRDVLSRNLKTLMAAHPELGTIKKVANASRSTLSNGKVGRIYAASHTTDIDTLQHLAEVFGLDPWQLLVEGIKADALPRLADAAVLNQILDAVRPLTAVRQEKAPSHAPAHQVKTPARQETPTAVKKAFRVKGVGRSGESGKPVEVQKSGAGRSHKRSAGNG